MAKGIDRYDEAKVKDLLRAFKSLNASGFGDDKSLADVGLDQPVATLRITLEGGGKRVLLVGKESDNSGRWVKKDDSDQIFSISSYAGNWTTAKVDKFQKPEDKDKDKDKDKDDDD